MTTLEILAVFVSPALLLGVGLIVLSLANQGDREHPHPGE